MQVSWPAYKWLRLPSRIALLLGLGALSAAGARADTGQGQPGAGIAPVARGHQARLGEALIRTEGGRIYLSEGGGEFREVQLADTIHARLLKQLVEYNGAEQRAGVRLTPMLLAGDGGSGFHWTPADNTGKSAKPGGAHRLGTPAKAATPTGPAAPEQTLSPRGSKIEGGAQKG
jgi:hypothetical protein